MTDISTSLQNSIFNSNEISTRDIESGAVQAKAQAEVQAKLVMAKRYPRSEEQAIMKIGKSLERNSFAESATYSFPRGGATVEGPSVNLAREMARVWGNIAHGVTIIQSDQETMTVEGWAWDFETNSYVTSQSSFSKKIQRKNKYKNSVEWITPDERDLRELVNKHGAICVRNSLLQLFPRDIIDACMERAKNTIKTGINKGDIRLRRAESLKTFDAVGISQEDLETYLNLTIDKWDAEIITQLIGIWNGIKDGSIKKEEIRKPSEKSAVQIPQAKQPEEKNAGI